MSSNQNQTKTQTQINSEKRYIIVNLLDLQTEHFSFGKTKTNDYGCLIIPLKYKGKTLHVKYPKKTLLFGVSANRDKGKMTGANGDKRGENEEIYGKGGKITGYYSSFSTGKDYENDPCYLKLKELDDFFIQACIDNCVAWRLGGTSTNPVSMETIAGYDEYGQNGKWKRLLKYSYKVDQNQIRTYSDYPPNYELAVPAIINEELNDDGKTKSQTSKFTMKFFDQHGVEITNVTDETIESVCPNFCEGSALATWSRITQGTYGASLKPRASQFRVYPRDEIDTSVCVLGEDDDEDEDLNEYEMSETLGAETVQTSEDLTEEAGDAILYTEGDDEVEEVKEVKPKPTIIKTAQRTVRKVARK